MNRKTARKILSLFLSLAMLVSLLAGLSLTASAAVLTGTSTGYTKASDVNYVTVSGTVANWGVRGETATFLTTYAQSYYTGSYSYATLSALSGDSGTGTSFYSSALGSAIHNMLAAKQTSTTSYNGTRDLYKFTDCVNSNYSYISSYYSGTQLNGAWDSGSTWNREHTWPNSKGLEGSDENDIMMLRPTSVSENSDRGNKAYGTSSSYYDPNSEASTGLPNLHGDVARLMLQHLMRWGNTSSFYGTGGVMESRAVLLQWMEEDPVDTWEMGRNDSVQSITGVRNVFVDYPELAFKLLGATMPSGYSTPSGGSGSSSSYTVTATSNNTNYGTVSVSGYTITASPKTGYYASGYTVTSGTATVAQNGNTFTVTPSSNCTVRINFAAKTSVTVTFSVPSGVSQSAISGYAGEAITLPTPNGTPSDSSHTYTFLGWVTATYDNVTTQPTILTAGSSYTPSATVTLYALYRYTVGGSGSSSAYTKISTASDITDGASYVFTSTSTNKAMSQTVESNWIKPGSTYSGSSISDPATTDVWTISSGVISCSGGSLYSTGAKNISLSSSTGTAWTFEANSGSFTIKSGNNIMSYNSTGWRPYSGGYGSDQSFYIYKAGSGGTNYYTTVMPSACEHTYTAAVTAPTCTAQGYTTYTCSKCGDTYTDNVTAALGHNYAAAVTAVATCTSAGVTTYTCSRCGDVYTEAAPAALGHSYGAWSSNNNGTHSKTCSRCSDVVTEDCAYTSVTNGATTTFTCTVCAYSYQTTRPTYTVTYNDRGSTGSVSCIDGDSVNLPATASTVEGYDFVGWVTAQIDPETTTAPTVLTGAYTPTASVTLYACYTRVDGALTTTDAEVGNSGASGSSYKAGSPYNFYYKYTTNEMLYTAAEIGGAGTITDLAFYVASRTGTISPDYVNIYMTTTSSDSLSTSAPFYASDLTLVYSGTPTLGSSTGWENLTLDTPFAYNGTDNLVVVTTQHVANYDNGKVQYRISSAPGCMIYRQSDTNANYGDASAAVSNYGSNGFTSITTRPAARFTLTAGTVYYTTAPTVAPGLEILSAALVLNGKIDVAYTVSVPSGYSDPCMVFTFNGASTTVTDYTEDNGNLKFTFTGVNPQCMGDDIAATLYATKNGATESVSAPSYSVRQYCVNKLADNTISANLRALLSDLLAYGAAAQTYMSYKTNALVTSGSDVNNPTYRAFSALSGNAASFDGAAASDVCWLSAGLTLTDSVAMTFRFYAESTANLSVEVGLNGRTQTFTSFTSVGDGIYEISFTGVSAEEFGDTVTAVFERSGEQVGNELSYTVNAYVQSKQNDGSAALQTLVRALYNYGVSAAAYAG